MLITAYITATTEAVRPKEWLAAEPERLMIFRGLYCHIVGLSKDNLLTVP